MSSSECNFLLQIAITRLHAIQFAFLTFALFYVVLFFRQKSMLWGEKLEALPPMDSKYLNLI